MKTRNIILGATATVLGLALISCNLDKYDDYSIQITNASLTSGSGTLLSTSTLSATGVVSGESCDLTITPQLASGSTWIDCTVVTNTTGTSFGAGTSGVNTSNVDCPAASGDAGRFAVAYSNCSAGTSDFTSNTSEFIFS